MNTNIAPTRSNLMRIKDELAFSKTGYDLLDQKRSILVSELLTLVDQAVDYQNRVEKALKDASDALEEAIMHMGRLKVANLAGAVSITSSISLSTRKVMGVELPKVSTEFAGSGPFFSPEGTSMPRCAFPDGTDVRAQGFHNASRSRSQKDHKEG